jgi:hypothetical protein
MWLAIALVVGAIAGICATVLSLVARAGIAKSALYGAGAFAGATVFVLTLLEFLAVA